VTSIGIADQIKHAAAKRLLFLPHAVRQMARPERMMTPGEVRTIIEHGELIEDYPRGCPPAQLPPPWPRKRASEIQVVCSPKEDYLPVITAYLPSEDKRESDQRTRKTT